MNAVSNAILASIGLEVLGLGPIESPTLGMTLYWVNYNAALINGWNVLAVEVHQASLASGDLIFDLALDGAQGMVGQPALGIAASPEASTLSWSSGVGIFGLYSATNLAPPVSWNAVTNTPVLSNGLWRVALPPDANSQQFYRLQTP